MNRDQYVDLSEVIKKPTVPTRIWAEHFTTNMANRTLLYGFDVDRITHHVYLEARSVLMIQYGMDAPILTAQNSFENYEQLIPNKRLYPEACDYDFCAWLKKMGIRLPFTTWDDDRHEKREAKLALGDVYYGRVWDPNS